MRISDDKLELLRKLGVPGAFLVSGEAGTGKTLTGVLCGQKLLPSFKPWQNALYLTYSKLAKRQISNCMARLIADGVLAREEAARMDVRNYHSLWWELISHNRSFLGISCTPRITTWSEAQERANEALEEAATSGTLPNDYRTKAGRINKRYKAKLREALMGAAVAYAHWGPEHFGQPAVPFLRHIPFLNWAKERIITWNRAGHFWHDETVFWARRLLRLHPNIRSLLTPKYPILIIDEFQDTDVAQWEMITLLAAEVVVAFHDPAQTIHEWRGADPQRARHFRAHFGAVGHYGAVREFTLTERHRAPVCMSEPCQIIREYVSRDDVRQIMKNRCLLKCKNLVLSFVREAPGKQIALLCLTNALADRLARTLRSTSELQNGGRLPPIHCARLGAENSPLEAAREILRILLSYASSTPAGVRKLQTALASDIPIRLLPLARSSVPRYGPRSKKPEGRAAWDEAGATAQLLASDFSSGLIVFCQYIRKRASGLGCLPDALTLNCIRHVGRSIRRLGVRTWSALPERDKLAKIDAAVLQYENARDAHAPDRVLVMTAHQSKSREFHTVIIPWFTAESWEPSEPKGWDTADPRIQNLFHTACTRATNQVIVVAPEEMEEPWPSPRR